jgi:hypothetical protein
VKYGYEFYEALTDEGCTENYGPVLSPERVLQKIS